MFQKFVIGAYLGLAIVLAGVVESEGGTDPNNFNSMQSGKTDRSFIAKREKRRRQAITPLTRRIRNEVVESVTEGELIRKEHRRKAISPVQAQKMQADIQAQEKREAVEKEVTELNAENQTSSSSNPTVQASNTKEDLDLEWGFHAKNDFNLERGFHTEEDLNNLEQGMDAEDDFNLELELEWIMDQVEVEDREEAKRREEATSPRLQHAASESSEMSPSEWARTLANNLSVSRHGTAERKQRAVPKASPKINVEPKAVIKAKRKARRVKYQAGSDDDSE